MHSLAVQYRKQVIYDILDNFMFTFL